MFVACVALAAAGALVLLVLVLGLNGDTPSATWVALAEAKHARSCSNTDNTSTDIGYSLFSDATAQLKNVNSPRTFSLTAADLSGDGWDDIIIGTHNGRPQLFLSSAEGFRNASMLLANKNPNPDWHALTAVDIDNDGYLDVAIAGGGADGVGKGTANAFFRNTSTAGVNTNFKRILATEQLAGAPSRARAFLPVASIDGKRVDLYTAALKRDGFPSRYWNAPAAGSPFSITPNPRHPLTGSYTDHGRGAFADFDEDGKADYLLINHTNAEIHWAAKNRKPTILATNAFSNSVGDINNDGLLDIYIGRFSKPTKSDRVSYNDQQINVVLHQDKRVDHSQISFESALSFVDFNFNQKIPLGQRRYPAGGKDIFLGRERSNPAGRKFRLHKDDAIGAPNNFRKAGIYVWFSDETNRWHIKWQFQNYADVYKAVITGSLISHVEMQGVTQLPADATHDVLLLNKGNGRFSRSCAGSPRHSLTTSGVTLADIDSNGWLDVVGVRHSEQGGDEGEIFLLLNEDGEHFQRARYPERAQDKLVRSDHIVHGFFNRDNHPDLAITYGFGQLPGTGGAPRLLLNQNSDANTSLVVDLQGQNANAFAIGARSQLFDSGNRLLGTRVVGLNTNLSQDTYLLHFGLGHTAPPYQLQVQWPDQTESTHTLDKPGYHKVLQPRAN